MTDEAEADWFRDWAVMHCTISGLTGSLDLLVGNRGVILNNWTATPAELAAVSNRWAARGVSGYPSELMGHLRRLLLELRAEAAAMSAAVEPPRPTKKDLARRCRFCRDCGFVLVPHPACVVRGESFEPPRLVGYAGGSMIATGALLCDSSGCAAGRAKCEAEDARTLPPGAKRRLRFTDYCMRLDIAPDDALALLEDHETELAEECRRQPRFTPDRNRFARDGEAEFEVSVERIKRRAA